MLALIKRLLKDNAGLFYYIYSLEIILRSIKNIWKQEAMIDMIHSLWVMVAATLLIIYSTYRLYRLAYTRDSYFYYSLKYSIHQVLLTGTGINIILNLIFYLLYCPAKTFDLFGKTLSLTSYFVLVVTFLYLFRSLSHKVLARNIFLSTLLGTLIAYPLAFYNTFQDKMKPFFIGASSGMEKVYQIYTSILPITIERSSGLHILTSTSTMVNFIIIGLGLLVYFASKPLKVNW